jgi:hypothetical protein
MASLKRLPFVSVITPTYERHAFLPVLVRQFQLQTYPRSKLELVILDDSSEPWRDWDPATDERVKYIYRGPEKMALGKKRNALHRLGKGEIFVAFDDDDVHSPDRVMHSVETMLLHDAVIAGCSTLYVCDGRTGNVYQEGPYHAHHGTAGTMAYDRRYLRSFAFDDEAGLAEEGKFTKGYSTPMVQLDPDKCIVCIAHRGNTVDKRFTFRPQRLLKRKLADFVQDPGVLEFFSSDGITTHRGLQGLVWSVDFVVSFSVSAAYLANNLDIVRTAIQSMNAQAAAPPTQIVLSVIVFNENPEKRMPKFDAAIQSLTRAFPTLVVLKSGGVERSPLWSVLGPLQLLHASDQHDKWIFLADPNVYYPETTLLEFSKAIEATSKAIAHGCGGIAIDNTTGDCTVVDKHGDKCDLLQSSFGLAVHTEVLGGLHAYLQSQPAIVMKECYERGQTPGVFLMNRNADDAILCQYLAATGIEMRVVNSLRLQRSMFANIKKPV